MSAVRLEKEGSTYALEVVVPHTGDSGHMGVDCKPSCLSFLILEPGRIEVRSVKRKDEVDKRRKSFK